MSSAGFNNIHRLILKLNVTLTYYFNPCFVAKGNRSDTKEVVYSTIACTVAIGSATLIHSGLGRGGLGEYEGDPEVCTIGVTI